MYNRNVTTNPSENPEDKERPFIYLEHGEPYIPTYPVKSEVLQVLQDGSVMHDVDCLGGYISTHRPIVFIGTGNELPFSDQTVKTLGESMLGPNRENWFVFQEFTFLDESRPYKELKQAFYYVLSADALKKLEYTPSKNIDYPGSPYKK